MSIEICSRQFIKQRRKINKFKVIPGWNRRVKSYYKTARENYLKWLENGKERNTEEFFKMSCSKREFKKALNQCKINEKEEIDISISQKYKLKDYTAFWKEVRKKRILGKKTNIIDGKNSCSDIINIFTKKFLLDSRVQDDVSEDECRLINKLRSSWETTRKFHMKISSYRLREYCNKLNPGMGHDGIHSLFLKNASDEFLDKLACFMNACFSHCFTPPDILKGDMNPTIKDLKGNITDSANYRPVMQSSCVLKLFELHILSVLEERVGFNSRQFGFRKGSSTSDACLLLKETIYKYTKNKDRAYVAFIDLSKAFDRVDHFLLGELLLQENIPPDLTLLIMNYLRNQSARVCWNDMKGDYENIDKGVRQGGILSPFLFKLYIDHVLDNISESDRGCKFGLIRMNVLAYADDLVIIADNKDNLAYLYKKLKIGMQNLKLMINENKSKCMIFERPTSRIGIKELKLGNDVLEVVDHYKYLGHVIQNQLLDILDIKQRMSDFNGRFNNIFRNFKNVSLETLFYLFDAFCLPDYGLCLWDLGTILNKQSFRIFNTSFNNALKRILDVPLCSSSHAVANTCNHFLLKHHLILVQARNMKRVLCSKNDLLRQSMPYLKSGCLYNALPEILEVNFNMNFFVSELDIVRSRLTII